MHSEFDIDEHIQNYWVNQAQKYGLPINPSIPWEIEAFWNPTKDRPMSTAEFLSHLTPTSAVSVVLETYERHEVVEERLPKRVRAVFLMLFKRFRHVSQLYSHLRAEPEDAVLLGYEIDGNGKVQLESYETLRQFINERLAGLWKVLIDAFLKELVSVLRSEGVSIGSESSEDATFLKAVKGDKEAEYNGYYKANGYKVDMAVENKHNLPTRIAFLDGNDAEGRCLPDSLQHLHEIGLLPDRMYIDGGYTSYENIAIAEIKYGVELSYRIEKDWVINPKGFEGHLRDLYQKHWKDAEFKPKVSTHYILSFLLTRGHMEEVGAHFRNMRMAEYEEASDSYLDAFHQRNIGEGFNGYAKDQIDLERDVPKGMEKVRIHALSRICCIIVAALTRAQNGVFEDLGSIAYIV